MSLHAEKHPESFFLQLAERKLNLCETNFVDKTNELNENLILRWKTILLIVWMQTMEIRLITGAKISLQINDRHVSMMFVQ